LSNVVEDETGHLGLFFVGAVPIAQSSKKPVHELKVFKTINLDCVGLIRQIGKYLKNGLTNLDISIDKKASEVIHLLRYDLLANILFLLHKRPQQINSRLNILVGLSLEILLNNQEELVEIQTHPGETTEYINYISSNFTVNFLLKHPEEHFKQI
jgi:hypothetical protein